MPQHVAVKIAEGTGLATASIPNSAEAINAVTLAAVQAMFGDASPASLGRLAFLSEEGDDGEVADAVSAIPLPVLMAIYACSLAAPTVFHDHAERGDLEENDAIRPILETAMKVHGWKVATVDLHAQEVCFHRDGVVH